MNIHERSDNRVARSHMARETLNILERGFYTTPSGSRVDLGEAVRRAVEGSKLYTPDELPRIQEKALARLDVNTQESGETGGPRIEVTGETTLQAVRRLVEQEGRADTLCLNFASAKNPGGGFLGGSQAQEESLARSSALYPCIAQMTEMYAYNRERKSCLYSHHMIYSPDVPVLREDDGTLLERPHLVSMITAPAVNAGVVRERGFEDSSLIEPVMLERIRYILSLAASHGHRTLVLGAFGCGVFRHVPADVARQFGQVLTEEKYGRLFDLIVFAVYDRTVNQQVLGAFQVQFGFSS
ncbi:TIGR02452 family protein [Paenibacillus filicis]|uniref:TIGR02452 family protein n=1 Tax=Paenibacillus filicis TaxID=669464 RepID=A0ABU9DG30_9BACL